MAIRDLQGLVDDLIPVNTVLISVSDKGGLETFVPGLVEINPGIRFLSTGGTYTKMKEILGSSAADRLMEVADYTEFPEMEGGLVKTLHPKIHAGILGERNHPEHQRFLKEEINNASYIDMVVVNLYPFNRTVSTPGISFEKARGHIDIGGPAMLRGAAKNFLGCAAVSYPQIYSMLLDHIRDNNGCTSFEQRFELMQQAFDETALYDQAIANYLTRRVTVGQARAAYSFREKAN